METAHSTYFTATSPLVSVLFVPSLHSYYFSRKFLFFSSMWVREYGSKRNVGTKQTSGVSDTGDRNEGVEVNSREEKGGQGEKCGH